MSDTASRGGYDSASEMFRGQTKEVAGRLTHDKDMEQEGKMEQASAIAKQKTILKPWRRLRRRP